MNKSEVGDDNQISAEIGIPDDAQQGEKIVVTDQAGNVLATYVIGENGVTAGSTQIAFMPITKDGEITINAKLTDGNGAVTTGKDTKVVDTIAPSESAPTISFEDAGEDGLYSQREVGEDGTITATVTMPEGTKAGDIVTINGVDYPVTVETLKDGQSIEVLPGDTVTASVKDTAGNTTPRVVETAPGLDESLPTAPKVTILGDTDGDGTLNSAEVGEDGKIEAEITIPNDAQAGDSIIITDAAGNTLATYVVGENGVTAGSKQTVTIDVVDGDTPVIKAEITDGNGEVAVGQDAKVIDTEGPNTDTTSIKIDPIAGDDILNSEESETTISVTGNVSGEFTPGDVVTLTVGDQTYTGSAQADGTFTIDNVEGSVLATNTEVTASVIATDIVGNKSDQSISAKRAYVVDDGSTSVATIIINDITDDNTIDSTELDSLVNISGTVSGDFKPNDKITLNVNGTDYQTTVAADGSFIVTGVLGSDLSPSRNLCNCNLD